MYMSVLLMYMYVPFVCTNACEVGRVHQTPWNLSYKEFELPCECWELSPGPLQEEQEL